LFDLNGFKQYNDTFGHPAGDALLARLGERLRIELPDGVLAYRMGGDEFCILGLVADDEQAALLQKAAGLLSETNETFSVSCSRGWAVLPTETDSTEEALRLADRRMYAEKASGISAGRQSTDLLLKVLGERSRSLRSHGHSVGRLARRVAGQLDLPAHEQERIQLAAELHDIGKTAIPDSLLNKPGNLTAEEWEYIHSQPLIGERIILAAPALAHTAPLVRSSHERIDGNGYPDSLAGDEIPIGARIIAVCDAYDAMISARSYRPALTPAEARDELARNAGTQFDPAIVDTFLTFAGELDLQEQPLAA
jgi:diguanylate cyclase (GGDEF)-like protein